MAYNIQQIIEQCRYKNHTQQSTPDPNGWVVGAAVFWDLFVNTFMRSANNTFGQNGCMYQYTNDDFSGTRAFQLTPEDVLGFVRNIRTFFFQEDTISRGRKGSQGIVKGGDGKCQIT